MRLENRFEICIWFNFSAKHGICDTRASEAYAATILRTVVNYDFSLALNIDGRVAQARNRTLLLREFDIKCSKYQVLIPENAVNTSL